MTKAGKQMIEGLKEAITMNSLIIENKMLAAELRQADDMALNQALTIKKLQEENETLRRDVKTAIMGDSAELQDVKRENEKLREALAAERERCAKIAEQARDDTCDGPVAWSMADGIAAAIRESGDE